MPKFGIFQNTKKVRSKYQKGHSKYQKGAFKIPQKNINGQVPMGVQNTKKITMNKALSKWISIKVATFKIPTFIIHTK